MKNPEPNSIYQHFKGGIYKILARAMNSETLTPMVVYQSLDDYKVWARDEKNFNEILEDGRTQRFSKLLPSSCGVVWQNLELCRHKKHPVTKDASCIYYADVLGIAELNKLDKQDSHYIACEKVLYVLKTFGELRNCSFDINPGKYNPTDKITSPEEWATLESNVFDGLVLIKVIPNA